MTSAANLTIVIDAINSTNKTLQQIKSDLAGVKKPADDASFSLGGLYKAAQAGFAIEGVKEGISLLKEFTSAAAEDEASTARLKQAVTNTGASYSVYSKQIDDVIKKGQNLGFTDDQTRSGLAILTAQTGDAGEAMKRFAIAEDLSRGANIDVVTASRLLGKVTDENVNVLNRYGIVVKKGATETELFAAIQQKFGGQAGAFADTAAGKMAIFNDKVHEGEEALGRLATPVLTNVATNAALAVEQLSKIPDVLSGLKFGGIRVDTSFVQALVPGYSLLDHAIHSTDDKQQQFNHDLQLFNDIVAKNGGAISDYSASLSGLDAHLAGVGVALTDQAVTNRGLVNAQADSIRSTQKQSEVNDQAYAYIATLTDATSKQITTNHQKEIQDKATAEANSHLSESVAGQVTLLERGAATDKLAAEARREYAAANGLLVDSQNNILPTLSELVGKTEDSYFAQQRDTEARREAYAALGLETDSMGNLIQTTEQLVAAQEDSINASIRQSNATLQVAQNDFPHLVQQERQSILASQAMAKASAEANKELIAEGLIADTTASSLDHLASSQYSVADYGTAALAPNFRPQDFQTIRGSPSVNGGGAGDGSVGGAGSVYRSTTSERPPPGFVGSFGGASYPAPRTSSSRSSARVVNQGTVINGNVYVTTAAQSFNAMQRI